jgi:hypothetical protein
MYTRIVTCLSPRCGKTAEYKIAAPWSSGHFNELKSYGLFCADHLSGAFGNALKRSHSYQASPDESVGEVGVYAYEKGKHDRELSRVKELEKPGS